MWGGERRGLVRRRDEGGGGVDRPVSQLRLRRDATEMRYGGGIWVGERAL